MATANPTTNPTANLAVSANQVQVSVFLPALSVTRRASPPTACPKRLLHRVALHLLQPIFQEPASIFLPMVMVVKAASPTTAFPKQTAAKATQTRLLQPILQERALYHMTTINSGSSWVCKSIQHCLTMISSHASRARTGSNLLCASKATSISKVWLDSTIHCKNFSLVCIQGHVNLQGLLGHYCWLPKMVISKVYLDISLDCRKWSSVVRFPALLVFIQ